MTVAGPKNCSGFFATTGGIGSLSGLLEPDYRVSVAAQADDEAGPDLEWLMAQPYDAWADARRSDCPVMAIHGDVMGPGTFYQVTRFKDADAVLRDDKT